MDRIPKSIQYCNNKKLQQVIILPFPKTTLSEQIPTKMARGYLADIVIGL